MTAGAQSGSLTRAWSVDSLIIVGVGFCYARDLLNSSHLSETVPMSSTTNSKNISNVSTLFVRFCRKTNIANTGSSILTVHGSSIGNSDFTSRIRISVSSCESTSWISATSVKCLISAGARMSLSGILTMGNTVASVTSAISYDIPSFMGTNLTFNVSVFDEEHAATFPNSISSRGSVITVRGSFARQLDISPHTRAGATVSEYTRWHSDTSLECKRGDGFKGSHRIVVTHGMHLGSVSEILSFDGIAISRLRGRFMNAPAQLYDYAMLGVNSTFNPINYTISWADFAARPVSESARLGMSSCETTTWISSTAVSCKSAAGFRASVLTTLTAGCTSSSLTAVLSYESPSVSLAVTTNVPKHASARSFSALGNALGPVRYTGSGRIGATTSESSTWSSDSCLYLKTVEGFRRTLRLILTVGEQSATTSEALSYDGATISALIMNGNATNNSEWTRVRVIYNQAATGSQQLILRGENFGMSAFSHQAKISGSATESTGWISASALTCRTIAGQFASRRMLLTAGMLVETTSSAMSYDVATSASSVSTSNVHATGSILISISGQAFSSIFASASARIYSSASELSSWIADTSISCKSSRLSMSSLKVTVTTGIQAGTASFVISYDKNADSLASTHSKINIAISGEAKLTLLGSGFGLNSHSLKARTALSQAESTEWQSDSSLRCLPTAGMMRSLAVSITSGSMVNSLSGPWTYDLVVVLASFHGSRNITSSITQYSNITNVNMCSLRIDDMNHTCNFTNYTLTFATFHSSFGSNHPPSGDESVKLVCSQLGFSDITSSSRTGFTSCESSIWSSETSLFCKLAAGVRATGKWIVTAGISTSSLTEAQSFDRISFLNPTFPTVGSKNASVTRQNLASTGGTGLIRFGRGFKDIGYSLRTRVGFTACEASHWGSDSSVVCKSPTGSGATRRLSLTSGFQSVTTTAVVSYIVPSLSKIVTTNTAVTGSVSITVLGLSVGYPSSSARLLYSAAEATSWISSSSITSLAPSMTRSSNSIVISVGSLDSSTTHSTSIDVPRILRLFPGNFPPRHPLTLYGNTTNSSRATNSSQKHLETLAQLKISGSRFSKMYDTQKARTSFTACEATIWFSDTSISCHVATGIIASRSLVISAGVHSGSASDIMSFDQMRFSNSEPVNIAVTGSTSMTISGIGMSRTDCSVQARIMHSAAESTVWISTSSIRCRTAHGSSASSSVILTSGSQALSTTFVLTFDTKKVRPAAFLGNDPSTGSVVVILVSGVLNRATSLNSRIGLSASESSAWVSETSLDCLKVAGRGASLMMSITSGIIVSSTSQAVSYDVPYVLKILATNCPTAGNCMIELQGSGFGSADFTPITRVGRTGCMSTPWKSESSIQCKIPRGSGKLTTVVSTVLGLVGSVTLTFSYDRPILSLGTLSLSQEVISMYSGPPDNSHTNATHATHVLFNSMNGTNITFQGQNFGPHPSDIFATFGHPPEFDSYVCSVISADSNDTQITCRVPAGIGTRHRLRVVVDTQIGVGHDMLSFPAPRLNHPCLRILPNLNATDNAIGSSILKGVDTIEISGSNFGFHTSDITVSYGPKPFASKYQCKVTSSGTGFVRCTLDSGGGQGLVFNVSVGRQSVVSNDTFSYPAPVLHTSSLGRIGGQAASTSAIGTTTQGGIDMLQMNGSFGPVAKDVIVKYGSGGDFDEQICFSVEDAIIDTRSTIRCVSSSGVGTNYSFNVSVSGQSTISAFKFHYPAPTITNGTLRVIGQNCSGPTRCWKISEDDNSTVMIRARSTVGGLDVVEFDGSNFGPWSDAVRVTYGECSEPCKWSNYEPEHECVVIMRPGFSQNHTRIQCMLGDGIGTGLVFAVTVGGQTVISKDRISYPDPVIYDGSIILLEPNASSPIPEYMVRSKDKTQVSGDSTVGGMQMIELRGRNFGPRSEDLIVRYGPAPTASKYNCRIKSYSGLWNHTAFRCIIQAGSGTDHVFRVHLKGGQRSVLASRDTFNYPPPQIFGNSLFRVEIPNSTANTSDQIGKKLAVNRQNVRALKDLSLPPFEAASIAPFKTELISIVNSSSTIGQDYMVVDGKNFGPDARDLNVTFSRKFSPYEFQSSIDIENTTQSRIFFVTPGGHGQNLAINVLVGGQTVSGLDLYSYPVSETVGAPNGSATSMICATKSTLAASSLTLATAGIVHRFVILARDWIGQHAGFGGDFWDITVVDARANKPKTRIVDNFDGTYTCYIVPTQSGLYSVSMRLTPLLSDIGSSPMSLTVLPNYDVVEPKYSIAHAIGGSTRTAGVPISFQMEIRDTFGNEILNGYDLLFGYGSSQFDKYILTKVSLQSDGRYQALMEITRSAVYAFRLYYNGSNSVANPYEFEVISNDPVGRNSIQYGASQKINKTADDIMTYRVQLADRYGNWRTQGGDALVAAITMGPISDSTAIEVMDDLNGSYSVFNRMTRSGHYTISLGLNSILNPLSFSPILVSVTSGAPSAKDCRASGVHLGSGLAGSWMSFSISIKDMYGNSITTPKAPLQIDLFGIQSDGTYAQVSESRISWTEDSLYFGEYYREMAGKHLIAVQVDDVSIFNSPFELFIDAAAVSTSHCTAIQTRGNDLEFLNLASLAKEEGLFGAQIMKPVDIVVRAKDEYGNSVNQAGIVFDLKAYSVFPSSSGVDVETLFPVTPPSSLGQGHVLYSFTPGPSYNGAPYKLTVDIKLDGGHIRGSPFVMDIRPAIGPAQPSNCIASGEGRSFGTAGFSASFFIQAVDYFGLYLSKGGETFQISMSQGSTSVIVDVTDGQLGSYSATFTATVSGTYTVQVLLAELPIKDSPFTVQILAAPISPAHCVAFGGALTLLTAGQQSFFTLVSRDKFSNVPAYSPTVMQNLVRAKLEGPVTAFASIIDLKNSSYLVECMITASGSYKIYVTVSTVDGYEGVSGSPFPVIVQPNEISTAGSYLQGSGMGLAIAGVSGTFLVNTNDRFFNPVSAQGHDMRFVVNGSVQELIQTVGPSNQVEISYTFTVAGTYYSEVQLLPPTPGYSAWSHFGGSPFVLKVESNTAFADSSFIRLPEAVQIAGENFLVQVIAYDRFGNRVNSGGVSVRVEITGVQVYQNPVSDHENGTYTASFMLAVGTYGVAAFVDRAPVPSTTAEIIPGPVAASTSSAVSLDMLSTTAGNVGELNISFRDRLYNPTWYRSESLVLKLSSVLQNVESTHIIIDVDPLKSNCTCHQPVIPGQPCECHRYKVIRASEGLGACNSTDTGMREGTFSNSGSESSESGNASAPWCACGDCACSESGNPITPPDVYVSDGNCTECQCNASIPIFPTLYDAVGNVGTCSTCVCNSTGHPADTRGWEAVAIYDNILILCNESNNSNVSSCRGGNISNLIIVDGKKYESRQLQRPSNNPLCVNCSCSAQGILSAKSWIEFHTSLNMKNGTLNASANVSWVESSSSFPQTADCSACMCQIPQQGCDCGCKPRICDCKCQIQRKCKCGCELMPPTPENVTALSSPTRSFFVSETDQQLHLSWNITRSGSYSLQALLGNLSFVGGPFSVMVVPGELRPEKTSVFGDMLTSSTAGIESSFLIQVRDQFENVVIADDSAQQPPFIITIVRVSPQTLTDAIRHEPSGISSSHQVSAYIKGYQDSAFVASYSSTLTGTYSLSIVLHSYNAVNRSSIYVHANSMSIDTSLYSSSRKSIVAGSELSQMVVYARDRYGNNHTSGGINLTVTHSMPGLVVGHMSMVDMSDGSYVWTGNLTISGQHLVTLTHNFLPLLPEPMTFNVMPGQISSWTSSASGSGIIGGKIGSHLDLYILLRDRYGNCLSASNSNAPGIFLEYITSQHVSSITPTPNSQAFACAGFVAPYQAAELGLASLSIKVNELHIFGSPFNVSIVKDADGTVSHQKSFLREPFNSVGTAGVMMNFVVQSVETSGIFQWSRTTGGLSFVIEASEISAGKRIHSTYRSNGAYDISITCTAAGRYFMAVLLDDPQICSANSSCADCAGNATSCHISGSPFDIMIVPSLVSLEQSLASSNFLALATAGVESSFIIEARDHFSNKISSSISAGLPFICQVSGPSHVKIMVQDLLDGRFAYQYIITTSGTYSVQYMLSTGDSWMQDPQTLRVMPGPVSRRTSKLYGAGLSLAYSDVPSEFRIKAMDRFGNLKAHDGIAFLMLPFNGSGFDKTAIDDNFMLVKYTITKQASYSLQVRVDSTMLTVSPLKILFRAGLAAAAKCTATGNGIIETYASEISTFTVISRDKFANAISFGGFSFTVIVTDSFSVHRGTCRDQNDGNYLCQYITTMSGYLSLAVRYNSIHLEGSPFSVKVHPSKLNATTTLISGESLTLATAGISQSMTIKARDRAGNFLVSGWDNFVVTAGIHINQVSATTFRPISAAFTDFKNGTYQVKYLTTRAGVYSISVVYQNVHVDYSPYTFLVSAAAASAMASEVHFNDSYPCESMAILGQLCASVNPRVHYWVQAYDDFHNVQSASKTIKVDMTYQSGGRIVKETISDQSMSGGTYIHSFIGTYSGKYQLDISIDGQQIQHSTHGINLEPIPFSAGGFFEASGTGLTLATAGVWTDFEIRARDLFGNLVSVSDPTFLLDGLNSHDEFITVDHTIQQEVHGGWTVGLLIKKGGSIALSVEVLNEFVRNSPFVVSVLPGPISAAMTNVSGSGIWAAIYNQEMTFNVHPTDQYSNQLEEFPATRLSIGIHYSTLGTKFWGTITRTATGWRGTYTHRNPTTFVTALYVSVFLDGSEHLGTKSMELRKWKGSPFYIPILTQNQVQTARLNFNISEIAHARAIAGVFSSFTLQMVNEYGLSVQRGGSKIAVEIIKGKYFSKFSSQDTVLRSNRVVDNDDGTFLIQFMMTVTGSYSFGVLLDGQIAGPGLFHVEVVPAKISAKYSSISGDGLTRGTAGIRGSFLIQARDDFSNLALYRPSQVPPFTVVFVGPMTGNASIMADIMDSRDSTYVAVYTLSISGDYRVQISVRGGGESVTHSFALLPASLDPGTSFIPQSELSKLVAGNTSVINILVQDLFGNAIPPPDTSSALSGLNCNLPPVGKIDIFSTRGNFQFTLKLTVSGTYTLALTIGNQPAKGSPYVVTVNSDLLSAPESRVFGSGLFGAVATDNANLELHPLDRFGNGVSGLLIGDVELSLETNRSGFFQFAVSETSTYVRGISYSSLFPCHKCELSIQIRGVHIQNSPLVINITPTEPPQLKSALFESHLAAAIVLFDQDTDMGNGIFGGVFDCKRLLDSATSTLMGQESKCSWTSASSFSIAFGVNAIVADGSSIALREGLVQNAIRNSKTVSNRVFLRLPTDVMEPQPVVNAPERIASCDTLRIDASSSYGDGGREMKFVWGLKMGPFNRYAVMEALGALPAWQRVVEFRQGLLLPDTTYVFTLRVRNFVGKEKATSFSVAVAGNDTPRLFIAGQSPRTVKSSRPLILKGRAALSSCSTASNNMNFSWMQTDGPELDQSKLRNSETSSLYLPPGSLAPGSSYTFRLTGVLSNKADAFSSTEVSIVVEASPLVAVILGGDRSHSESLDLELDASTSIDPASADIPFRFEWYCVPSPCFEDRLGIMTQNSGQIRIPAGSFNVGTRMTFSVLVSKDPGPRTSSASVTYDIVQSNTSSVKILRHGIPTTKLNADDRLALLGVVRFSGLNRSCVTPSFSWSLLMGDIDLTDDDLRSTPINSPNLVLKSEILTPGMTYVFSLQSACSFDKAGNAQARIVVNKVPIGGTFTVSPASGTAFQTRFWLMCSKWVDDVDDLPLQYSYQMARGGDMTSLQPLSGTVILNSLTVVLGASHNNNSHVLIAQVCDVLGACSKPPAVSVSVFKSNQTPSAALLFDRLIVSAQGVGDLEQVVGASGTILDSLNTGLVNNTRRAPLDHGNVALKRKILTVLTSALSSTVITQDLIEFISSPTSEAMKVGDMQIESYHMIGLSLIETLTKGAISLGEISTTSAKSLSNALAGTALSEAQSRTNVPEDGLSRSSSVFSRVQTALSQLAHASIKNTVAFEDPLSLNSDAFLLTAGRYDASQFVNLPLHSNSALNEGLVVSAGSCKTVCNTAVLPSLALPATANKDVQFVVWKIELYKLDSAAIMSDVTSLSFYRGPEVLNLSKMESPAVISLAFRKKSPLTASAGEYQVPKCEFWNTYSNSWSSKGCIAIGSNSDGLRCACFHLTDFAAVTRPVLKDIGRSDEFLMRSEYLVENFRHSFELLAVTCATFVLGVICALVGYCIDNRTQKERKVKRGILKAPHERPQSADSGKLDQHKSGWTFRFKSLFLNLWARRSAQLMKTQHGVLGILSRTATNSYDRAGRVTTLFLYLASALVINTLFLGEAGFPDEYFIVTGMITGLALVPLQPIYSLLFRMVETPSAAKRRVKRELKASKDEIERQEKLGRKEEIKQQILDRMERKKREAEEEASKAKEKARIRAARRGRVEVTAHVETVSQTERQQQLDTISEIIAGANMGAKGSEFEFEGIIPHKAGAGRSGPRVSEDLSSPHEGDMMTEDTLRRPPGLPPIKLAFDADDLNDRKRRSKAPKPKDGLPREFLYVSYVVSLVFYGLLIFISFQYGTSFRPTTQMACLLATLVTFTFEFLFWQPLALIVLAFIQVKTHLWRAARLPKQDIEPEPEPEPDDEILEMPTTPPPPTPPPPVQLCLGFDSSKLLEQLITLCCDQARQELSLNDLYQITRVAHFKNPYQHTSKLEDRDEDIEDFWMSCGVQYLDDTITFDTLLDNVQMGETERIVSKFFLRHDLEHGKICSTQVRSSLRGLMPDEHVDILVKRRPKPKKAISERMPSLSTDSGVLEHTPSIEENAQRRKGKKKKAKPPLPLKEGGFTRTGSNLWARLRGDQSSGVALKTVAKLPVLARASSAERISRAQSVESIEEESDSFGKAVHKMTFRAFRENVHELILHLKTQGGEVPPPEKRLKKGVKHVVDALRKEERSSTGFDSLFTRAPSFFSVTSSVMSKLRSEKQTQGATPTAEFARVGSFERFESVNSMASKLSQQNAVAHETPTVAPTENQNAGGLSDLRLDALQGEAAGGTTHGTNVAEKSRAESGVQRRLKAATAKVDINRARRSRAAIPLLEPKRMMYDVEPELLEVPLGVINLEELQAQSLPGTPENPLRKMGASGKTSQLGTPGSEKAGTKDTLGMTPGEFGQPIRRPDSVGSSRPSTQGSEESPNERGWA